MAFDTGSPIGSTDARDLYDNAQNLDYAVNQSAARWTDRFGVSRPSWAGMVAYADRGAYAAGIVITGYNEMFLFDGEYYRAAAATILPYITTGSWSDDGVDFVSIGDAALRSDLSTGMTGAINGVINVAYFGTLEEARTNSDAVGRTIIVDVPLTEAQSNILAAWPADRALKVEKGGSIANSTTFTINGPFEAGLYHVFISAGSVTFGAGSNTDVFPEWWGAKTDSTTNSSPGIQSALNSGAKTVRLVGGSGEYSLTSTLNVPMGVSIIGNGTNTIIRPVAVDAFLFLKSDYVGGTKIANFTIMGNSQSQYAFKYESLIDGDRITGILFENITTGYISPGYFNGLWHSTFRNCTFYGCYNGLNLSGRNIKILVDDCRIIKGATGTGDSTGILVTGAITPTVDGTYTRGEDIQIRNTLVFGYDVAINLVDVMMSAVTNSDLDYVKKIGIKITQADTVCNITNNWIAVDASTTYPFRGVSLESLVTIRTSQLAIHGNVMIGIGGALQSEGVYVGGNQRGAVISNNELRSFKYGLSLNGGDMSRIVSNTFSGSVSYDLYMFSTKNNYIAGNIFTSTAAIYRHVTQTGSNQYGENTGWLTRVSGVIPVPSGQLTATATLASLGLPTGNQATSRVYYYTAFMPNLDRGALYGLSDGTNISFTAKTAYGPASMLAFTIQAVDL